MTVGRAEQPPAARSGPTVRTAGWTAGAGLDELECPVRTPGRANAGRQTTRGAKPWTYSRREDVAGRGQKRRAEDLAERVSGVKDVINALRIVAGVKSG